MSYSFEIKRVKNGILGRKSHLMIRTEDGRVLDHFSGSEKGIKKASFFDHLSLQGRRVVLDGKVYHLKNKSLNKYLIRNGTRLTFDRYSARIHQAVSKGFNNAIRFLPSDGRSKSEMRGQMILKCLDLYCNPSMEGGTFPYDEDPASFKKNYRNALKWEQFFLSVWKLGKK